MKFEEEYLLRLCKPEEAEQDAPIIAALIREMAQEAHADHIPELPPLIDLVYSLLTTGFSEWIIAEVDKQAVGCLQINYRLSTWTTAAYAYLEDIYVQPNVRQLGIAKSMVDYAYQRAETRSCAYVEIEVAPDATEAIASYKQLKFEEAPITRLRRTVQRSRCCGGHGHHHDHKQAHDHGHDHECCGGQGHHDHGHDHECCGGQGHHDHDHDHECCGGHGHHDHGHDHECCGGQGHHDHGHGHDHECCGGQGHHDHGHDHGHDHDHECCGGQGTCTCEEE